MTKLRAGDLLLVGSFFCDLGVVVIPNPQRQAHRAQANAGGDESGEAAHQATFRLFGWLRSLRAWLSATRAARSTGFGGGGGTEPVRKCGGWLSGLLRGQRLIPNPFQRRWMPAD